MRSDLEVSFRRRGVYRKLEETGKSPVSSLYFYLFRFSRLLPVFCRWALFAQSIVRKHDVVEDFVAVCNTTSFFRLFSFAREVGASIIDPADFSVLLAAQFHSPTADPVRLCTRGRVAQVERIIHGIYRAPHFHSDLSFQIGCDFDYLFIYLSSHYRKNDIIFVIIFFVRFFEHYSFDLFDTTNIDNIRRIKSVCRGIFYNLFL